jgi:arylsulfatase A-like enzyme
VQAPEEYVARYRGVVKNEGLARYYAAVTCMDEVIGKVLKALDDAGQTENTIVMFLSDNGGSGNGGNAPLKGSKGTMREGGLRVPFLIRWPGKVPAGRVTHEFLTTLEIMPTLLAATGTTAPAGVKLDGFDMLPVLRGERPSPRTEMFWQRRSDKAARVGQWKWVDSAKGKGLYDLSTDIGESTNLTQEKPEIAKMVQDRFNAWKREMDASEPRGPFGDY